MSFPPADAALTHILVVRDIGASIAFYRDVLGADLVREYSGTSAVFSFNGAWILLVTGGGPTPDKPGVAFAPPTDPNLIAHAMTIRVPDCREAYKTLADRGADFLTPPIDNGPEIRCFFRDPDGHLFEISEFRAV
jgi:catechol 2,3-dioxygenase-like lactoylglutathione lyase family enzyme